MDSNLLHNHTQKAPSNDQLDTVLSHIKTIHKNIQQQAKQEQSKLNTTSQQALGPKFSIEYFNYEEELEKMDEHTDCGVSLEEAIKEIYPFFQGAIRLESPMAMFNVSANPLPEATAASCLASIYNVNFLMDAYAGKGLLIEQKVARTIGNWMNWKDCFGISCNGGKTTLLYAVKSALSRIAPTSQQNGIPDNLVIITNQKGHYSIDHVASILGIGSHNCLRISSDEDGKMNLAELELVMGSQIKKGKMIAAIICCGGTTIDFICDDTKAVAQLVDRFTTDNQLQYRPYLHLDAVIGWIYFSLLNKKDSEIYNIVLNTTIAAKIIEVKNRFQGLASFDSFGTDFHKVGLCPYTSSFFISRNKDCLNLLTDGNYKYTDQDFNYGQFRSYRYTIENSRPSQGILSSWTALLTQGRNGFIEYLTKLHSNNLHVVNKLEEYDIFNVINKRSLGWEVVFSIRFNEIALKQKADFDYNKTAMAFMQRCWDKVNRGAFFPLFSIVPDYFIQNGNATTAFLIYPTHQNITMSFINNVIDLIFREVSLFEQDIISNTQKIFSEPIEKPIR